MCKLWKLNPALFVLFTFKCSRSPIYVTRKMWNHSILIASTSIILNSLKYLDQIVWIKLSRSNSLDQIIRFKLSRSDYLDQCSYQLIKRYIEILKNSKMSDCWPFLKHKIHQRQIHILRITRNFSRSKIEEIYRGSPPDADFGARKKTRYAQFTFVGL